MTLYLDTGPHDAATKYRHAARYLRAITLADRWGGLWLDAACGSGYGTALIKAIAADVAMGVDSDGEAIDWAITRYPFVDRFVHRDVLLPTISPYYGPFDVILSVETVEHLPKEKQPLLVKNAYNWLAEGGVFVMTCPLSLHGGGPNPLNPKHLHEPRNIDEVIGLLEGAGFRNWRTETEEAKMTTGMNQVQVYAMGVK